MQPAVPLTRPGAQATRPWHRSTPGCVSGSLVKRRDIGDAHVGAVLIHLGRAPRRQDPSSIANQIQRGAIAVLVLAVDVTSEH
jgi:hypothetical protein